MLFSPQQKNCLEYLMQGMTFKEVGRKMNLSPRTVEYYIHLSKKKLGVRSRVELLMRYYTYRALHDKNATEITSH